MVRLISLSMNVKGKVCFNFPDPCIWFAEPHSSVGSVADLRRGGCWFWFPAWPIFFSEDWWSSLRQDSYPHTAVHCFDNGYVEKWPEVWKEYCPEYCLKELQEGLDRCTDRCNITEILLKTALNTIQPTNQIVFDSNIVLRDPCSDTATLLKST